QSTFWDQSATTKQFAHPLDVSRFSQCVPRDATILDYGCGYGRLCGELFEAGYSDLKGLDYSREMIRTAQARYPELHFAHHDAERLPFDDASFDAVLLFAVLTCIPSDAAQRNLIAELARVLRPGGVLIVSDYALQNDERNRKRYEENAATFGHYGTFLLPDGGVVRHHPQEWFNHLLAAFAIEHRVELNATTMNGNPARITQIWARVSSAPNGSTY
ncbi:MAG: class I SAM-dependent methyltransferase, partial [Casimicrobium sp.]